jgi:hypothetical protein
MYSAYVIRMEKPEGRYWTTIVGNPPATKDNDFVDHRTSFLSHLVEYNELKEARVVRTRLLDNQLSKVFNRGGVAKVDLVPEATALGTCLTTLHKKLGL